MNDIYQYIPSIPTEYGRATGYLPSVKVKCYCGRIQALPVKPEHTYKETALDEIKACECGGWEKWNDKEKGRLRAARL